MLKNFTKYCKKNTIIAVILILLLCLFAGKALAYNLSINQLTYSYEAPTTTVGGIWNASEMRQTFVSTKRNVSGFSLRFGTYARTPEGTVTVSLVDASTSEEKILFTETFDATTLIDNEFKDFNFDPVSNCKNKTLAIVVTADGVDNSPVTLWCSESNVLNNGALAITGATTDQDLNIKLYHVGQLGFNDYLMIAFFAFLIFCIIFMAKKKMLFFADGVNLKFVHAFIFGVAYILTLATIKTTFSDGAIQRTPNWPVIVSLILLIAITIIFEKKIKLYARIKEFAISEYACFKDKITLIKDGKNIPLHIAELFIRMISLISTPAFVVTVMLSLLLCKYNPHVILVAFIFAFIAVVSTLIKKVYFQKDVKVATLFLVVSLIFGMFLSFGLPPTTDYLWDAEIHHSRVIDLKCMLFNDGRTVYDDIMKLKHQYLFQYFFYNSEGTLNLMMENYSQPSTQQNSYINFYQYIGYLPAAIGVAMGQLLSMNLLATISTAKLFNLLVYVFVIYCGIKRLKSGKYLFSAVALIPCCLLLASGFSYDFWVTAFIFYAYACFISELQKKDEKITSEVIFLMLAAMVIGCGPKMVYFALIFPMLFIGRHKFENKISKRNYIIACTAAMTAVFISFALPFLVNVGGSTDIRGGTAVNSGEQFSFILNNPFKYAEILIKYIAEYIAFDDMTLQITNFCYFGIPNPIFGTIFVALILFTAFTDREADLYPCRKRLTAITWVTCFIQIVLIASALYISFTPVGHTTVNGCQYRYLFPILAPFFYFFGSNKIKCEIKPAILNTLIFCATSFALFMSYYDIYLSHALEHFKG